MSVSRSEDVICLPLDTLEHCVVIVSYKEQKITLIIGLELYCGKPCLACSVISLRSERTTGLEKRQINILDSSLEENYM